MKDRIGFFSPVPIEFIIKKKFDPIFIPYLISISEKPDNSFEESENSGFLQNSPFIVKTGINIILKYNITNIIFAVPTDIREVLSIPDLLNKKISYFLINYHNKTQSIEEFENWLNNLKNRDIEENYPAIQTDFNKILKIYNKSTNNIKKKLPNIAIMGDYPLNPNLLKIINNKANILFIETLELFKKTNDFAIFTNINYKLKYFENILNKKNISHIILLSSTFSSIINYEIILREFFVKKRLLTIEMNNTGNLNENVKLRIESFLT